MVSIKIIVFIACALFSTAFAQNEQPVSDSPLNPSNLIKTLESDVSNFYEVSVNFFKSPFQFSKNDFYLTGVILGVTAAVFPVDEPVRRIALRNHSKSLDNLFNVSEKFGNARYSLAMSGILYGGGLLFSDKSVRESGQILAEAIIFNGLITTGAKLVFNRARPFTNEGSYKLDFFEFDSDFDETSLPSGHTSTAFTIATVLSQRLSNTYASLVLYSMATLTAFQRIYADRHWFSDTLLGAALGTVIGLKVVKLHEQVSPPKSGFSYNIYPCLNSGNYSIGLALRF